MSRPARSLPSTLTSVFRPVLTCEPPAPVARGRCPCRPNSPPAQRRPRPVRPHPRQLDSSHLSLRRTSPRWRPSWAKSRSAGPLPIPTFVGDRAGTVRRRCGHSRLPSGGRGWPGGTFWRGKRVSVDGLVADLVGLHATDPATPYLSLWARLPGFAVADLDAELYEHRTLVKHLAMRRTLWVVRAEDLPLIQSAASDRVADNERRRLVADAEKAGIADDGDAWLDTACAAVLRHLAEHGAASAKELREALPELAGSYDPAPGKRWGGETPSGAKGFDRALGARRHRPRARTTAGGPCRVRAGRRWPTGWRHGRRRRAGGGARRTGAQVAARVRARPPSPTSSGGSATR